MLSAQTCHPIIRLQSANTEDIWQRLVETEARGCSPGGGWGGDGRDPEPLLDNAPKSPLVILSILRLLSSLCHSC